MEAVVSIANEKGPLINPAQCRCCRSIKKCRLLTAEYEFSGKQEVYSDMFIDCFGLLLSHLDGEDKDLCICTTCVGRLRDACAFRQQVLRCEQLLLSAELEIKKESELNIYVTVKSEPGCERETNNVATDGRHDAVSTDPQLNVCVEIKPESVSESETDEATDDRDDPDFPEPPQKKCKLTKNTEQHKDNMMFANALTLVHNSYICPFVNQLNVYCCYYCRIQFTNPWDLREHTFTHDPETFESNMVDGRMPKIDITRIDCRLCAEKIDDLTTLRSHLKAVHGKDVYPVIHEFMAYRLLTADSVMCTECNEMFPYFDLLQKHVNIHFGSDEEETAPPEISNEPQVAPEVDLLPPKSRSKYLLAYDIFISWKNKKKYKSFSEDVFMTYFQELSGKYKPSSLWATYSMLKTTLKSKIDLDLKNYMRLTAFLKQQSNGFTSKRTQQLTAENVERFVNEAPDDKYLLIKVILIFGITGSCRRQELANITMNDIENHGELLLVKIPDEKTKIPRTFTIHGQFYKVVKKYEALRVTSANNSRFFQNYINGKCTRQFVGVNKIGNVPKKVATFLKLPDPESYTGHSFRRTSIHQDSDEEELTSPKISNEQQVAPEDHLPAKSRTKYLVAYDIFITWKQERKYKSFSEDVLMAYFQEMSGKYKPSSLWATYSMLKCTIKSKHDIDIKKYVKLTDFLKQQAYGFASKKSQQLTAENVERFLIEAPDDKYLLTKVILIFGITGACRRQELADIATGDIENHGELLLVKIPDAKTKVPRTFTIHGQFYKVVKKYEALRVTTTNSNRFFQNYINGKCTRQFVGVNKIGNVPKKVATFLKLPDPESYTGHSFRRSSYTMLNSRVDVIKNHKRRRSNNVTESCIERSQQAQDKT